MWKKPILKSTGEKVLSKETTLEISEEVSCTSLGGNLTGRGNKNATGYALSMCKKQ